MPWWIWLFAFIVVALVLHRRIRRVPAFHRSVELGAIEPHVRRLTASGRQGAVLVLERVDGSGTLQLEAAGGSAVELVVPDVPWSAAGLASAEASLAASGFRTAWDGGSSCGDVRRSLRVSAGDVRDAVRSVRIAAAALGWRLDVRFTVHLERG